MAVRGKIHSPRIKSEHVFEGGERANSTLIDHVHSLSFSRLFSFEPFIQITIHQSNFPHIGGYKGSGLFGRNGRISVASNDGLTSIRNPTELCPWLLDGPTDYCDLQLTQRDHAYEQ